MNHRDQRVRSLLAFMAAAAVGLALTGAAGLARAEIKLTNTEASVSQSVRM